MCINDWRLGRYMRTSFRVLSSIDVAPLVVPSSRQRCGILFNIQTIAELGGAAMTIQVDGVTLLHQTLFQESRILTLDKDGDIPTREFTCIVNSAVAINIGVTEFFLPEEYLEAGYNQWKIQRQ